MYSSERIVFLFYFMMHALLGIYKTSSASLTMIAADISFCSLWLTSIEPIAFACGCQAKAAW